MTHPIYYVSTNRNVRASSGILPFRGSVSFAEALMEGQAPDEGLFMPRRIPRLSQDEIFSLKGDPYPDAAKLVAAAFLGDEIEGERLRQLVADAYNYPVPIIQVTGRKYVLCLDQVPTASFKDFAARFMARLMWFFRNPEERLNVLVATSGDTGSAVGDAFRGMEGVEVFILYPSTEVSCRQKRQLDGIGSNVRALSIDGKFDDCQNLVKQAFADFELAGLNLTSANSINFGRILPQIVYYIWSYSQLAERGEEIIFSVPSGNFGNALGCEYARRMGLPVKKLLMPTNANREFARYLETGLYEKIEPALACISNAMNVGHPSNLARLFNLYGGTVDRKGLVHRYPDREEMKFRLWSVGVSDLETKDTIREVYKNYGVLLEPHGAVGWRGLMKYDEEAGEGGTLAVSIETAHPAKFPEAIEEVLGISPDLPQSLKDIDARPGKAIHLPASYGKFKEYLLAAAEARN